ncbi:MAG TPA: DUF4124 domain-containing protein [Rhodanobacteraceae bacterium]
MHLRPSVAALAIGMALACTATFASAQQIYKWKDASGVIHFSQTPPTNGVHYVKMHLQNEPEVASTPAASAAPTQPAQPDNPAPAANAATQPDTASNRAKLCRQLGSNIALLQGKQPVVTGSGNGKQEVLSGSARAQQLATARAQQAQYCAPQQS